MLVAVGILSAVLFLSITWAAFLTLSPNSSGSWTVQCKSPTSILEFGDFYGLAAPIRNQYYLWLVHGFYGQVQPASMNGCVSDRDLESYQQSFLVGISIWVVTTAAAVAILLVADRRSKRKPNLTYSLQQGGTRRVPSEETGAVQ